LLFRDPSLRVFGKSKGIINEMPMANGRDLPTEHPRETASNHCQASIVLPIALSTKVERRRKPHYTDKQMRADLKICPMQACKKGIDSTKRLTGQQF
jgi:hypothetical protein